MTTTQSLMADLLAGQTTASLIESFALTEDMDMRGMEQTEAAAIFETRGALMDELERRNPAAFSAWIDTDEMDVPALRAAFEVA